MKLVFSCQLRGILIFVCVNTLLEVYGPPWPIFVMQCKWYISRSLSVLEMLKDLIVCQ